jgi:hypothetical protein
VSQKSLLLCKLACSAAWGIANGAYVYGSIYMPKRGFANCHVCLLHRMISKEWVCMPFLLHRFWVYVLGVCLLHIPKEEVLPMQVPKEGHCQWYGCALRTETKRRGTLNGIAAQKPNGGALAVKKEGHCQWYGCAFYTETIRWGTSCQKGGWYGCAFCTGVV